MIPPKYWSPTKKMMVLGAMAGGKLVEDTATGNPLTFITDKAKPLKSLLIPFSPRQEGSGDPSPENIRPLVPWEGLSVFGGGKNLLKYPTGQTKQNNGVNYAILSDGGQSCEGTATATSYAIDSLRTVLHAGMYTVSVSGAVNMKTVIVKNGAYFRQIAGNGQSTFSITEDTEIGCYSFANNGDTVDETIYVQLEVGQTASAYEHFVPITETDISFPSPVYGGQHEAVSGRLSSEWASYTFNGSESMSLGSYSGTGGIRINTSDIDYLNPAYNMAISDIAIKYQTVPTVIDSLGFRIGSGTSVLAFFVPHSMFDGEATIEKFKEWLASHNMTICTKLATPQEQTLTGHQITALVGDNTIWSDADGQMTAVYLKRG